jgi:hypothetical protein
LSTIVISVMWVTWAGGVGHALADDAAPESCKPTAGTVMDGAEEHFWDAPVWFCDPWPHPFGLAGLEDFLHHFVVTIRAYDGCLDIEPNG